MNKYEENLLNYLRLSLGDETQKNISRLLAESIELMKAGNLGADLHDSAAAWTCTPAGQEALAAWTKERLKKRHDEKHAEFKRKLDVNTNWDAMADAGEMSWTQD
jgi:hypothetical protein